jgi:hypothetical protein
MHKHVATPPSSSFNTQPSSSIRVTPFPSSGSWATTSLIYHSPIRLPSLLPPKTRHNHATPPRRTTPFLPTPPSFPSPSPPRASSPLPILHRESPRHRHVDSRFGKWSNAAIPEPSCRKASAPQERDQ